MTARRIRNWCNCASAIGLALVCSDVVLAQGLRDPTAPPAVERPLAASGPASTASSAALVATRAAPMGIIVRDGRPQVISGTRLYGVGQMLGAARIECITETQIWLREGGELRKVEQFSGIVRQTDPPPPPVPAVRASEVARVSRLARPASAPKIEISSVACGNRQP